MIGTLNISQQRRLYRLCCVVNRVVICLKDIEFCRFSPWICGLGGLEKALRTSYTSRDLPSNDRQRGPRVGMSGSFVPLGWAFFTHPYSFTPWALFVNQLPGRNEIDVDLGLNFNWFPVERVGPVFPLANGIGCSAHERSWAADNLDILD